MNLDPIDLVSAHRWEHVTFTTYALSLSFFEAVVLDALTRGGARQALILADVHGVRASLSHPLPRRATDAASTNSQARALAQDDTPTRQVGWAPQKFAAPSRLPASEYCSTTARR